MNQTSSSLLRGAGLALAVVAFAGCASAPFQASSPREAAYTSMDKAASDVAEINGRIDGAIRALDDLVNHPAADMKAQYKAYTGSLEKLEDAAEDLGERSANVQKLGQSYFINWDREIAAIRDEDLRNRSNERKAEVTRRFETIRNRYVEAREALVPLVRTLNEAKTALSVDLTSAGVNTVEPTLARLRDQADPARDTLGRLAEELRAASVTLAAEVNADRRE